VGELFPLLAGVLAGVVARRLSGTRLRVACVAIVSVVFGVLATLVNRESALLIPVDAAIVAVTGAVILAGPQLLRRLRPKHAGDGRVAQGSRPSSQS
jgi:peptidoglycan/LPS O-acetylase OafA/YrhL